MSASNFAPRNNSHSIAKGFAILAVVLVLTVVAAVALLLTRESASNSSRIGLTRDVVQAQYVSEAGFRHAQWKLAQSAGCAGYTNLLNVPFSDGSYSVMVAPDSGSPVSLSAVATLANGSKSSLWRDDVKVYDHSSPVTLILQPGPEGKDTDIEGEMGSMNDNNGSSTKLEINSETNDLRRILLQFDLSILPTKALIQNATLELYLFDDKGADIVVEIYRLLRDWTEGGVTWNNYDGSNAWDTPGGDYDTQIIDSFLADGVGWKSADVTPVLQAWVNGSMPNYGLILLSAPAVGDKEKKFRSSDDNDFSKRPKLTISYVCECGMICSGMAAGNTAVLSTETTAGLGGLSFSHLDLIEYEPASDTASYVLDGSTVGLDKRIDAVHMLSNGHILLSTDGPVTLGGLSFNKEDLVDYDPITDTAILFFDGSAHFKDSGEDTIAVHLLNDGRLVLATENSATLGGVNFSNRDLLAYDPGTRSAEIYFDGDPTTLKENISGVHVLENGRLVLSAKDDTTLGGLIFTSADLIEYDIATDSATLYLNGRSLFTDRDERLNSLHILGDNGPPVENTDCSADFIPDTKIYEFALDTLAISNPTGVTFLSEGTMFNGLSAPVDGAWLIVDGSDKELLMTNMSGNLLSSVNLTQNDPKGVVLIGSGPWQNHLALTDPSDEKVYILDLNGVTQTSFSTRSYTERPIGLGFIKNSVGGTYDDHLLISSHVDDMGASVALVAIVDQNGNLKAIIDTSGFTVEPWGVAHIAGSDKVLIVDITSTAFIVGFDGTLYEQYDITPFGPTQPHSVAINPNNCDHTILAAGIEKLVGLNVGYDYLDKFNAVAFTGNDGMFYFSDDWQELGEFDGPGSGRVRVTGGTGKCTLGNCLRIGGTSTSLFARGVSREADLSNASAATLSFTVADTGSGGSVALEVSSDGGGSWSKLKDYTLGSGVPGSPTLQSFDIIPYAALNTQIRFIATGTTSGEAYLYIDDVRIKFIDSGVSSGVCAARFRDRFNERSYSGSDGNTNWSTDWLEINEYDGPVAGDEAIIYDQSQYQLRLQDNDNGGEGVERELDLSGYTTASLELIYRRHKLDNSNDYVTIDISDNGGNSWTELDRIEGPGNDSEYQALTYDISGYISNNTRIRFLGSSSLGKADRVWFDNIEICAN